MDLNLVHGKRIVITGAFGALGSGTALAAARMGAEVALINHSAAASQELKTAFGPQALLAPYDLAHADQAIAALERAQRLLGGIDVLVNVAGAFRFETVADGSSETWQQLFDTNLKTALNASQAALPHLKMSKAGRIVNVGANAALKSGAGMGAYAASKSALHRLTESLAEELKKDRITVNAVLPSIIDTPANRRDMPDADFSRWVSPASLANVILFLASDLGEAVTGALLPVTGRV